MSILLIVGFISKVLKNLLFLNLDKIFKGNSFVDINLVFPEDIEINRFLSKCL
jgi:hypothetical protein